VGVPGDLATDVDAEELAVAQEAIRDRSDASGVVASFGGPLLVCVGDADDIVPVEEARELAADALLGSFALVPHAGHLIGVDQPERLNAILVEFMSQWT
jgi:pimeloyl-ACP methyl ester carboxylesterase